MNVQRGNLVNCPKCKKRHYQGSGAWKQCNEQKVVGGGATAQLLYPTYDMTSTNDTFQPEHTWEAGRTYVFPTDYGVMQCDACDEQVLFDVSLETPRECPKCHLGDGFHEILDDKAIDLVNDAIKQEREELNNGIRDFIEEKHEDANAAVILAENVGWLANRGAKAISVDQLLRDPLDMLAPSKNYYDLSYTMEENGDFHYIFSHPGAPGNKTSLAVKFLRVNETSDEWKDFILGRTNFPENKEIADMVQSHISGS